MSTIRKVIITAKNRFTDRIFTVEFYVKNIKEIATEVEKCYSKGTKLISYK